MRRRSILAAAMAMVLGGQVTAGSEPPGRFVFDSIDGGQIDLAEYRGGPVLVVNTASRCGFTGQYEGLQALWDKYRDQGLTVLGVPSNSFRQELASAEAVADFCETSFGITFPMTEIVPVTGSDAHPFYAWAASQGAKPRWNFHKILLDGEGRVVGNWTSFTGPESRELVEAIEAQLPKS